MSFAPDDMVYGLANGGRLRATQQLGGGKLLTDVQTDEETISLTKEIISKTVSNGNKIHFDLTGINNVDDILSNTGEYANKVTSIELRYIRDNWDILKDGVKFYKYGVEVIAPWL